VILATWVSRKASRIASSPAPRYCRRWRQGIRNRQPPQPGGLHRNELPGFAQHVDLLCGPGGRRRHAPSLTSPVGRYRSSNWASIPSRPGSRRARRKRSAVVSQYSAASGPRRRSGAQSRVDLAQALYDQAADLQKNGVGTASTPSGQRTTPERKAKADRRRYPARNLTFGLARLLNSSRTGRLNSPTR